jgi:CheY-like chemotaxis protein
MLETHLNMNQMGSGLGLCISQQVANLLGYKVSFCSQFGFGSIFSLDIPLQNEEFIPLITLKSECDLNRENNSSDFSDATIRRSWNLDIFHSMKEQLNEDGECKKNSNILNAPGSSCLVKKSKFHKEMNEIKIKENEENNSKKVFLIIDDVELVLNSIERAVSNALKKHRINDVIIIRGRDGVDALKEVINDQTKNKLACIFIDEYMNYINGNEAINMIRQMERSGRIKKQYICKISSEIEENNLADINVPKPIPENLISDIFKKLNLI